MNKTIVTLYQDYLKLTGNKQVAALLVHSQIMASFDETLISIYEDVKKLIPQTLLQKILGKLLQ